MDCIFDIINKTLKTKQSSKRYDVYYSTLKICNIKEYYYLPLINPTDRTISLFRKNNVNYKKPTKNKGKVYDIKTILNKIFTENIKLKDISMFKLLKIISSYTKKDVFFEKIKNEFLRRFDIYLYETKNVFVYKDFLYNEKRKIIKRIIKNKCLFSMFRLSNIKDIERYANIFNIKNDNKQEIYDNLEKYIKDRNKKCKNNIDPVSFENINEIDISKIFMINNHFYSIDTLINLIEMSRKDNLPIKDPLDPSYN